MGRLAKVLLRGCRRHAPIKWVVRMFPKLAIQEVYFNQCGRLLADLRDPNARQYFLRGEFEPEFFRIALPFLRSGGVFFDIGANFGFCSFGLVSLLQSTALRVHAFEANPNLVKLLRQSAELQGRPVITVNHACVCDRPGFSRLAISRRDLGQSYIGGNGGCIVENLTLDSYCRSHAIQQVHFAKFDVEGFEPHAFRGAAELLCSHRLSAIYFEVSPLALRRQRLQMEDTWQPLIAAGYSLYYCKAEDVATSADAMGELEIQGERLKVRAFDPAKYPPEVQTDLLAVAPGCGKFSRATQRRPEILG